MDQFASWLANRLQLQHPEVGRDVRLFKQATADFVLRDGNQAYIVEVKGGVPRWDDVARLQYLVGPQARPYLEGIPANAHVQGVLVAPAISEMVRIMAQRAEILAIEAPIELLPVQSSPARGLTTERAWRICTAVLRARGSRGVRELARHSSTSIGWTSMVVQQLRQRGILDPSGDLAPNGTQLLLDAVATERPLRRLETARIQTGIRDWSDFEQTIMTQWMRVIGASPRPGFWVCGLSAAAHHSGYLMRHDQLQVYAHDAAGIAQVFDGKKGGIEVVVFRPDRNVAVTSGVKGGLPTVDVDQTLLDVAGLGFQARDVAMKLIEALQREGP